MSTDLVTMAQTAGTALAVIPQSLHAAVRFRTGPRYSTDFVLQPPPPDEAAISAAKAVLPAITRAVGPVDPAALRVWLRRVAEALPLGSAQSNPHRLEHAVRAICEACGHMPAACFTDATRAEVLRRCRFFPGAAELTEILAPVERNERDVLAAVRSIAAYVPPLPAPEPITPEQRGEMQEKLRGLADELRQTSPSRRDPDDRPTPFHLTTLQLALAARRSGSTVTRPDWIKALAEYDGAE